MPLLILSRRARITAAQAGKLLRCYAKRQPPKIAAKATGLSLNTIYLQYNRICWRLVLSRYYRDGTLSYDEPGLAPEIKEQLRQRRGIEEKDIYPHAAELIDWAEEWPPKLALKHIRKIIKLTGPLDMQPELSDLEIEKLQAYVRYTRKELIYDRLTTTPDIDEAQQSFIERTKAALDNEWRSYRAATKRWQRDNVREDRV